MMQTRGLALSCAFLLLSLGFPAVTRAQENTPTPLPLIADTPTPAPTPTPDTGIDVEQHFYEDPDHGWTLSWDPQIWSEVYPLEAGRTIEGDLDAGPGIGLGTAPTDQIPSIDVRLNNVAGVDMRVALMGQLGPGTEARPSVEYCLREVERGYVYTYPKPHNVAKDANGGELRGVAADNTGAWEVLIVDGTVAEYLECRLLEDNENFVLFVADVPVDQFATAAPLIQQLLVNLNTETSPSTPTTDNS